MAGKEFDTKIVTLVASAHMVHDIFGSFLAPLMPLLITKLGFTLFMAGFLDVSRKVPALFNPIVGRFADKSSMRWFVIIAPSVTAVAMSLLGAAPSYWILLLLIVMAGVGSTLFHVPEPVIIARHSGERVGRGMSFYMVGGELARTLGPLLVLGAVSLWGLEGTYRLIPLGIGSSLLLWWRFQKVERKKHRARDCEEGGLPREVKQLLFGLSGITFTRAAMKAAVTIYLPTYLMARGQSLWVAGLSLSLLQLSGTVGVLFSGTLSDFIGRRRSMFIMNLAAPLIMILFMVAPGILTIPALLILGPFLFGPGPVMLSTVHQLKRCDMAFINGLYMTLNFVLNSIMILLVGFFADRVGLISTWWGALCIAFFALPFTLLLPREGSRA